MTQPPQPESRRSAAPPRELIAALERGSRFLILGHTDPDVDSVGSQLALAAVLRARGKQVALWSPSPLPDECAFLPSVEQISTEYPAGAAFDVAVALDAATLGRFGDACPFVPGDFPVLINIDHHGSNEQFGTLNWVVPTASSVGEMLFELFDDWGVELGPEVAVCLYASIASDTGGFAFSNTTARALEVAGALVRREAEPFELWRALFGSFPLRRHQLLGEALRTLRLSGDGRIAWMRITQQMLHDTGAVMEDSTRFVFFPRTIRGVEVAAVLREQADGRTVRVGLRSNVEWLDVARIAAGFNGGGHARASACSIEGTLDEAEAAVVAAIEHALSGARRTT